MFVQSFHGISISEMMTCPVHYLYALAIRSMLTCLLCPVADPGGQMFKQLP